MRKISLVALLVSAACAPAASFTSPVTHPTADVSRHSVGIAAGGLYGSSGDSSVLVVPHGEGWVRLPAGAGQIDFHVVSGMASLGYRFDIKSLGAGGVGFALEPSFHGAYVRTADEDGNGDTKSQGVLFVGGAMKALILIPSGASFFYLAPVAGISHGEATGDAGAGGSVNILGLGGAVGYDLGTAPIGMSFELAFQHSNSMDDDNSEGVWLVIPTIGFRL